jgi:fucose transport system substrate-binding protein
MKVKRIIAICIILALVVPGFLFAQGAEEGGETVVKWPTIWVGEDSKAGEVERLVNEFNEINDGTYQVDIEANPDYDGYRTKINALVAANAVPDIFVFNPDPTAFAFYEGDLLMDFTDELAGPWGDVFVGGSIAEATKKGETKSVPFEIAVTPIWYNEALMTKAGVKEFPETMDEFWVICDQLKAAGIIPTSQMTGGTNAWTSMLWFSHIAASIGGPDVWEKPITDKAFVQAAEILLRMYSDGNTSKDAVGGDAGIAGGHFLAGRSAMFINGPWYIGRVRGDAPEVYANTGIAALPAAGTYPGGQMGFPLSSLAAAATDDAAKEEAVVAFMKWMTTPENVKGISMDSGALFAIQYEMGADDVVDPLQKKFMEAVGNATFVSSIFSTHYGSDVVAEFGQALAAMALGKATPTEFVQQIADSIR